MRTPPHILVVDDQPMHVDILKTRLAVHGYAILTILAFWRTIANK
jgi:CheY-like chemotaxis protein